MSPTIRPCPLYIPSHDSFLFGIGGGEMVAMGFPLRVTRIGLPVRLTLSNTARQVALNCEIVIVSFVSIVRVPYGVCNNVRTISWSGTMVNGNSRPLFFVPSTSSQFAIPETSCLKHCATRMARKKRIDHRIHFTMQWQSLKSSSKYNFEGIGNICFFSFSRQGAPVFY